MDEALPGTTAGDRLRKRRRALQLTLQQVAEELRMIKLAEAEAVT
ncbi:MAG: hypothetical protein ABWY04_07120 [Arthrobacter sp.]